MDARGLGQHAVEIEQNGVVISRGKRGTGVVLVMGPFSGTAEKQDVVRAKPPRRQVQNRSSLRLPACVFAADILPFPRFGKEFSRSE